MKLDLPWIVVIGLLLFAGQAGCGKRAKSVVENPPSIASNSSGGDIKSDEHLKAAVDRIKNLGGLVTLTASGVPGRVNLDDSNVSNDELEHVAKLTDLIELHLIETNIGDAGMEHVKGLSCLAELNLDRTEITDAGLKQIGEMVSLKQLYVCGTGISDAGLE